MKDKECTKKWFISTIAVFIFLFAYDWLVHGKLMHDLYEQTKDMWRPMSEMNAMMPYCIAFHLLLAATIACMYKGYKNYNAETCGVKKDTKEMKECRRGRGICFGTKLGFLLGLLAAATYIFMPISKELAVAWFFAGLFKGLGAGVVLSLICDKKEAIK